MMASTVLCSLFWLPLDKLHPSTGFLHGPKTDAAVHISSRETISSLICQISLWAGTNDGIQEYGRPYWA
jgi:hypothetical protein